MKAAPLMAPILFVVWPLPGDGSPFTWAHVVIRHTETKLEVACGLPVRPADAIVGTSDLATMWGKCPPCSEGRTWTEADFAALRGRA